MKYLFLFFVIVFCKNAYSIEFIPKIKTFSQNEYQAGVENWCAISDSNGVMYFANSEGILEFDGIHWNLLKTKSGFSVRSLEVGKNNCIYVSGDYDFGYLAADKYGKKSYFSLVDKYLGKSKNNLKQVWRVVCDSSYIYYLANSMVLVFDYKHNFVKQINEDIYLRSFFNLNGEIIGYSNQKGLLQLNAKTLSFSVICNAAEILNQSVEYIALHPNGGLRLHVFKKGFYQFQNQKISLEKSSKSSFLEKEYPFCSEQNTNEIFIGTTTNGLCSLDKRSLNEKWHLNKSLGLNDDKIFDLYVDRFHNLWVCHENGLSYISLSLPVGLIDERLGVSGQGYSSTLYNNQYFMGTSNGLYVTNATDNKGLGHFKVFNAIKQPTYFLKEIKGKLLIGCHLQMFVYDGKNLQSLPFSKINKKAVICPWDPNFVYVSTEQGIVILSVKDGFKKIGYLVENGQECRDLEIIDDQVYYIDPLNRLVVVQVNKEKHEPIQIKTITDKRYYSLTHFKKDFILGTSKGLFKFNQSINQTFVKIGTNKDTLPINLVYNEDDSFLWVEKSQFEKGKQRYKVEVFDNQYQLDANSSELNAVVSENKIFSFNHIAGKSYKVFGTTDGFILLNTNKFIKYEKIETYIRKIDFNLSSSKHSMQGLWKEYNDYNYPVFHDEEMSVEVDCASNIYNASDQIFFSYQVEGQDSIWSNWQEQHKFVIPILDHGKYKLKVRATADFHTYSKTAQIVFEIKKPWYLTYWWYTLEILILLLVVSLSSYFNRTGNNKVSKISAIIIVLIILTLFETISELVQDWLDAKGAMIFTLKIAINILIALSINPIENWLKYQLIKKPIRNNLQNELSNKKVNV